MAWLCRLMPHGLLVSGKLVILQPQGENADMGAYSLLLGQRHLASSSRGLGLRCAGDMTPRTCKAIGFRKLLQNLLFSDIEPIA